MTSLMLANVTLAVLLAISGVAKLRSPDETRDAFVSLRLPRALASSPAPRLLPWAELALAILLIASTGWLLVATAVCSLLLFLAYTVVIARALSFDERVECNCFGVLGAQGVSGRTLVRNVVLVALAVAGLIAAMNGQSLARLPELAGGWEGLLMGGLATAALLLSLDPGAPAASGRAAAGSWVAAASLEDPATGSRISMRELGMRHDGATLVFLRPGCGSCERLVEEFEDLQASTARTIAPVVTTPTLPGGAHWQRLSGVLVDAGANLGIALTGGSTPAAVAIGQDGLPVGEPAIGIGPVKELIGGGPADEAPTRGHHDHAPSEPEADPEPDDYVRRPIPSGVLIGPDGAPSTPHELASRRAQLLVGIDCMCGDARRAVAALGEWQRRLPVLDVRLVVPFTVQPGTFTADQEALALYDHRAMVSAKLNLVGPSSAVLLGADGLLAGGPVTGFDEVEAFVNDISAQLGDS